MPRKKIVDPAEAILGYFESAPVDEVGLMLKVIGRIVANRQPRVSVMAASRSMGEDLIPKKKKVRPVMPPAAVDDTNPVVE